MQPVALVWRLSLLAIGAGMLVAMSPARAEEPDEDHVAVCPVINVELARKAAEATKGEARSRARVAVLAVQKRSGPSTQRTLWS